MQEMNTAMVGWVSKVLTSVMDFCNLNKTSISLPQPPPGLPVAITNNYNGTIAQQIASAGCIVSDMQPKVLLPVGVQTAYDELARMGMPSGEKGFDYKTFAKYYRK